MDLKPREEAPAGARVRHKGAWASVARDAGEVTEDLCRGPAPGTVVIEMSAPKYVCNSVLTAYS